MIFRQLSQTLISCFISMTVTLPFLVSCKGGQKFKVTNEAILRSMSGRPYLKIQNNATLNHIVLVEGTALIIYVGLSTSVAEDSTFDLQIVGSRGEDGTKKFTFNQNFINIPAKDTSLHVVSITALDDAAYFPDSEWILNFKSRSPSIDTPNSLAITLKDNDSNSSLAPVALLSELPPNPSKQLSLSAKVTGNGLYGYKYKLGPSLLTQCDLSVGYSAERNVNEKIIDSLTPYADGPITLCVIGRDAQNNYQAVNSATQYIWQKDTVAPVATLMGAPSGVDDSTALSIKVNGSGVESYKYKIRRSSDADAACSLETGYSPDVSSAVPITDNIFNLPDGNLRLCVVATDAAGNTQAYNSATFNEWSKDTSVSRITTVTSSTPDGAYGAGKTISIQVVFTKVVKIVSGTPSLRLNSGSSAYALYAGGSDTNTLNFNYTVAAGEETSATPFLNYQDVTSLSGALIQDKTGTTVNSALPDPNGLSSLQNKKRIVIDTTPPNPPFLINTPAYYNKTTSTPICTFDPGNDGKSGILRYEARIVETTNGIYNPITNFAPFTSGSTITSSSLLDGRKYQIILRSIDGALNASSEVASRDFTLDTTPPSAPGAITVGAIPEDNTITSPTFSFQDSTDSVSPIQYYRYQFVKASTNTIVRDYTPSSSGNISTPDAPFLINNETYYTNIVGVDYAGNVSTATRSPNWVNTFIPPPSLLLRSSQYPNGLDLRKAGTIKLIGDNSETITLINTTIQNPDDVKICFWPGGFGFWNCERGSMTPPPNWIDLDFTTNLTLPFFYSATATNSYTEYTYKITTLNVFIKGKMYFRLVIENPLNSPPP